MKKALTALLLALPLSAVAAPIEGVIAFFGLFTDNVDETTQTGTLDFSGVSQVSGARTDDFTILSTDFFNVDFGPIAVTAGVIDLPVNPMWSLDDGFGVQTAFILDTVTLYTNDQDGVAVEGWGDLTLTGFDTTRGFFSLDTADNELTFDADAKAVPAPGMVALLGIGLVALGLQRRQRSA